VAVAKSVCLQVLVEHQLCHLRNSRPASSAVSKWLCGRAGKNKIQAHLQTAIFSLLDGLSRAGLCVILNQTQKNSAAVCDVKSQRANCLQANARNLLEICMSESADSGAMCF
jgi:hypothetical protein